MRALVPFAERFRGTVVVPHRTAAAFLRYIHYR